MVPHVALRHPLAFCIAEPNDSVPPNRTSCTLREAHIGSDRCREVDERVNAFRLVQGVIASVPRGKVITYGNAAAAAGFPGAARLTVRALQTGKGLPWHRVVGAGGRISLEGEEGREQRLRLEIEGVSFRGGRVRMDLHAWAPRSSKRRRSLGRNAGTRRRPN
jgi:methylated-DNA-protein-cysteine methyltransferase related protein